MAILVFSPNGTYVTKPTLEAARTSADCAGKTVVVTTALTAAQSDITAAWPADRALEVKKGGSIANTAAFPILSPASFEAGEHLVFAGSPSTVTFPLGSVVSVAWFGADLTGASDSSAAIQLALNTGASEVIIPTGLYLLNTVLTMKPSQSLIGDKSTLIIGNVLSGALTANNAPVITMSERTVISGFIFRTQTQPVINATTTAPVIHPYCISVNSCSYVTIQNIDFLACWRGIVAGNTSAHECMTIKHMRGTIFETPIYIDQNTDVDRLMDIQLNSTYAVYYGGAGNFTSAAISTYQRVTLGATAITVARADWMQISNCFAYGYKTGLLLQAGVATVSGPPTVSVSNCGFDGMERCVVATAVINASFSGCTFAAVKLTTEAVYDVVINGNGGFQFSSCLFNGNTHTALYITSSGTVTIANCEVLNHYQGVNVSSGNVKIDSTFFMQSSGTLSDINLTGTGNTSIKACSRYDKSSLVTVGVTSTTCLSLEDGTTENNFVPLVASKGVSSTTGFAPTLIANTTTHYFTTLPAGDGHYLVYTGQSASTTGAYYAIALVRTGSTSATVAVLSSYGITIAVSGLQVGVTNSAGGDLYATFNYLKLS